MRKILFVFAPILFLIACSNNGAGKTEGEHDHHAATTAPLKDSSRKSIPSAASVQVGMVGRAITIAESTPKVKLVPNAKDKLGIYFCNECGKYFN